MAQISNERNRTIVDYQKGAGNPYIILDTQGEVDAPSGGGISVDSKWGRGNDGSDTYIGGNVTSNPERYTFTAMWRTTVETFLKVNDLTTCPVNIRVRHMCGDIRDITNYQAITEFIDAYRTSNDFSDPLANNMDTPGSDQKNSIPYSAGERVLSTRLQHTGISKTVTDVAINKVIYLSAKQCYGDCGDELDGTNEIAFVTDLDAAPGYAGTSAPYVGFSENKGATWDLTSIDDFLTANATGIVKHGDTLVVFSPSHGPTRVALQDLRDDLGPTSFTASTGITANFPNDGMVMPNGDIYAFGDGGYIYVSTDGGGSWSSFDAALITTANLTVGTVSNDNLAYIGGAAGVVVKIKGPSGARIGSLSTVKQADGTVLADAVTAIAAPADRDELFLGTDAGTIWRSKKPQNNNKPAYTLPSFQGKGVGTIEDLQFTGFRGAMLFIIQTDAAALSRVLIDRSGGNLGTQTEVVGSFNSPANNTINSIAVADNQHAITVGEVANSVGFIGLVRQ